MTERSPDWIVILQDLKTLKCQRCGQTHVVSVVLPAPTNEWVAIHRAAEKRFAGLHQDCLPPETHAEN